MVDIESESTRGTKVLHVALRPRTFTLFRLPLLQGQKKQGLDVQLACCKQHPQFDVLLEEGFTIHEMPITRSYSYFSIAENIKIIWWLRKLIQSKKFQLIHTHQPIGSLLGLTAALLAGNCRMFHTTGGLKSAESRNALSSNIYKYVERFLLKRADAVFSVNNADLQTMRTEWGFPENQAFYVGPHGGCGIDLNKFNNQLRNTGTPDLIRESLNIPESHRVICSISRLVWEKGYLEFIEAAELLLKTHSDLTFLIVGDGVDEDDIKQAVENRGMSRNFIFSGRRNNIVEILTVVDVFVAASHREAFGLSAAEAMAMELPVVMSDVRGHLELFSIEPACGVLFPVKNSKAIANNVERLLSDESEAQKIGRAARVRLENEFSREKLLDEHLKLTTQIIKRIVHNA